MFENYKDSLFNNKIILQSQQSFKSDRHEVYTEESNKIALSSNDDKRLKHLIKLQHIHMEQMPLNCESEMIIVRYFFVKNYVYCPFYNKIKI